MTLEDWPLPNGDVAWVNQHCGAWFEEAALPALHPSFTAAAVCAALYNAPRTTVDARLVATCPHCASRPTLTPVHFIGVTLDVCGVCRGVWVDHHEHITLLNALHLHTPGRVGAMHYRSAAVMPTMVRKNEPYTRCVRCGSEALVSDAMPTEHGFMCFACGSAHAREG
jgi:Zn-finger nucleic acid-binding protein